MRNNDELLSAAFERSELILKRKSALRRKTAACVSVFAIAAAITTAVFVSGGFDRITAGKPIFSNNIDVEIKENDNSKTAGLTSGFSDNESSKAESSTAVSEYASSRNTSNESSKAENSTAVSEYASSRNTSSAGNNNSKKTETSSGENSRNTSEEQSSAADNESSNMWVSSRTYSTADASSDIDPSVDRSQIPEVSKIAESQNDVSSTPSGSAQSDPYDPDTATDTEVWYDPDVFYDADNDEKGYDSVTRLIDDSQAVVIGTVESIGFEAPPIGEDPMAEFTTPDGWRMGTLFTVYTVKTEEICKGDINSEEYIKIYSFGGIRDRMVDEQLTALGGDRMIPVVDRIDAQADKRYIFILTEKMHYVPVNAGQSIYYADDMSFTSLYGNIKTEDIYNELAK